MKPPIGSPYYEYFPVIGFPCYEWFPSMTIKKIMIRNLPSAKYKFVLRKWYQ